MGEENGPSEEEVVMFSEAIDFGYVLFELARIYS